jgi:adenylate cyclase
LTRTTLGVVLTYRGGRERDAGLELLAQSRVRVMNNEYSMTNLPIIDCELARDKARRGELDAAIELARTTANNLYESGGSASSGLATTVLVQALLQRGSAPDLVEARAAIDRLAVLPADPGPGLRDVPLARLNALLARAQGDDASYRAHRDRYREMAKEFGFEGHIAWAEAMP